MKFFFMRYYVYESERDKDKKTDPFYQGSPAQTKKQNITQKTQT